MSETIAGSADTLGNIGKANSKNANAAKSAANIDLTRIYGFSSLNQVTRLAHILVQYYNGKNSLYKDEKKSNYVLVVTDLRPLRRGQKGQTWKNVYRVLRGLPPW